MSSLSKHDPVSILLTLPGCIFCLPLPAKFSPETNKIHYNLLYFLSRIGCRQIDVAGEWQHSEFKKCSFIFAQNFEATEGEDYFRHIFFNTGKMLHLPFIVFKSIAGDIYRIATSPDSNLPVGLQEKISIDDKIDIDKIISLANGVSCHLESIVSEKLPVGGMHGAMLRQQTLYRFMRRGEDWFRKEWGLHSIPEQKEILIYGPEDADKVDILRDRNNWSGYKPADFFKRESPIYMLTTFRDDFSLIDNYQRNTWLKFILHDAGMVCLTAIQPETGREYIVAQNVVSIANEKFFKRLLELCAQVLEMTEQPQIISTTEFDSGFLKFQEGLSPDLRLIGAAKRELVRANVRNGKISRLLHGIIKRTVNDISINADNNEPANTPSHSIIQFLNSPESVCCLRLSASDFSEADITMKQLAEIISAAHWCAGHGAFQGGASPLRAVAGGTGSQRQGRCREARSGGSPRQKSDVTNRNRI